MKPQSKQASSKQQKQKSLKTKHNLRQQNSQSCPSSAEYLPFPQKDLSRLSLNDQHLQRKAITVSQASKVIQLLHRCEQQPNQCFKQLLNLYRDQPQLYLQVVKSNQSNSGRLLFVFIQRIALCFQHFPFFQQQKTVIILQKGLKMLSDIVSALSPQEMSIIEETNQIIWHNISTAKFQLILENLAVYFFKYSIFLGKRPQNETRNVSQRLICFNIKQLILQVQRSKEKSTFFRDTLTKYVQEAFEVLVKIGVKSSKVLPLYDITALSLVSQHKETYKLILSKILNHFRLKVDEKKDEILQNQEIQSIKDSQYMISSVFLSCNLFNLTSVFSQTDENPHHYSKQVIFATLIILKQSLMRSIDQIEKIQKSIIPNEVIRQLFCFSSLGNNLNRPQTLKQLINKVITSKDLHQQIQPLFLTNNFTYSKEEEYLQAFHKAAQKTLFQLLYKIEKAICHFNLDTYMDLYIENPWTFRSQYFILNLYQFQHLQTILRFMLGFTKRWILSEIKQFDFNFYLLQFFKKCVAKDNLHIISKYVRGLEIEELLKINLITFKLSFQQEKKKLSFPQPLDAATKLAQLTSAGFYDKFQIITKLLPDFSEQLLWKQVISSFFPSENYIYVKAFYHILHYQLNFSAQSVSILEKVVDFFQTAVANQKIEECYSIFHMFTCVYIRLQTLALSEQQNKGKIERKMLKIVLERNNEIKTICQVTCQRRRNAMSHITLKQELVNENMKYFQKIKRMHHHFIKNVILWLNQLSHTQRLIQRSFRFEQAKQIYEKLSKELQYPTYHFLQSISHYCSEKYFSNLLKTKIKERLGKKEIMNANYILILQQTALSLIGKYNQSFQSDQYCIGFQEILYYFRFLLSVKMSVTNERQVLKQKLIILELIMEILQFFSKYPQNQYVTVFNKHYCNAIKPAIIQIALQNPDYVQKYQRQLIIHLRMASIKIILHYYQTPFEVLTGQDFFSFVYQICFDKIVQIRFMMLNIFLSRFKNQYYKNFLQCKYYIISYLTVFANFQPQMALNISAKKAVQAIKKVGNDECSLGLIILLYSIKLLLNRIRKQLVSQNYFLFLDMFLKGFDQLWLIKKEWEASVYAFCISFLQEKKIAFLTSDVTYKSHITSYIIARQKSDFVLQNEVKEYLKNQANFSFEFPPQERVFDSKENQRQKIIYSLAFRVFQRLKQIIIYKQRNTRVLKCKKDVKINWDLLKKEKVAAYHPQTQSFELITFSMI